MPAAKVVRWFRGWRERDRLLLRPFTHSIEAPMTGSAPHELEVPFLDDAVSFLRRLGFLGLDEDASAPDWRQVVSDLQAQYGHLKTDGIWGPKTQQAALATPRCGTKESFREGVAQLRWRKDFSREPLTWAVNSFDDALAADVVVATFERAWAAWVRVAGIRTARTASVQSADVRIDFGRIDGPGRTLAWAELPVNGVGPLQVMFDLGEIFAVGARLGVSRGTIELLNVATHEFGHILGMEHIQGERALLNPIYDAEVYAPLEPDVRAIRGRYGQPFAVAPTPNPNPPQPAPKEVPMRILEIIRFLAQTLNSEEFKSFVAMIRTLLEMFKTQPAAVRSGLEIVLNNGSFVPRANLGMDGETLSANQSANAVELADLERLVGEALEDDAA